MDFSGMEESGKFLSLMARKKHKFYALKMRKQEVLGRQNNNSTQKAMFKK